jgi:hypothetical protein
MIARDQPLRLVCDRVKAWSDGFAGVDQHNNVKLGFVGSREAAEIADDDVTVDYGEVISINGLYEAIVLVGGKKRDPHLRSSGAVSGCGRVVVCTSTQNTRENAEQNCQ